VGSSEEGQPSKFEPVPLAGVVTPEALNFGVVHLIRGVVALLALAMFAGHIGFVPDVKTPCGQEHQDPYPQVHDPKTPSLQYPLLRPLAGVLEPRSGA
jgi:hypothetical protein